jgi:hypothetical protein
MILGKGLKYGLLAAAMLMTTASAPVDAATSVGVSGTGDLAANRASAELTLSVQCDGPANEGELKTATLTIYLFQSVGRLINIGVGTGPVTCDGNSGNETIDVDAIPGLKFQPGPATVLIKLTEQTTIQGQTPETQTVTNSTTTESGGKVNLRP